MPRNMSRDSFEDESIENTVRGMEIDADLSPDDQSAFLEAVGYSPAETATNLEGKVSAFLQARRARRTEDRPSSGTSGGFVWRHPSVQRFAGGEDPIQKMVREAGQWALEGLESNDSQTPADPFALAKLHNIDVVPRENIADARVVPLGGERYTIEFNPNQPGVRIRFSIAHELAHTIFRDCGDQIRNRASRSEFREHEWELEMLCNIGAAELLMPIATFPDLRKESLKIDSLMELRKRFQVSSEALLLRIASLSLEQCAVFAASLVDESAPKRRYKIDYLISSRAWQAKLATGHTLGEGTRVAECTAIGFTTYGNESWSGLGNVHLEAVGISPYPGGAIPRVVGLITPATPQLQPSISIRYVRGDATDPRGPGKLIIAHVVNDVARTWGVGFARAVAGKWPNAQDKFTAWTVAQPGQLRLGNTFQTDISPSLKLVQMVCQRGYGKPSKVRLRYSALKSCLDEVVRLSLQDNASVHMPRIGTGQGGGLWGVIEQLIDETLCRNGIPVTIYDLPGAKFNREPELLGLFEFGGKL